MADGMDEKSATALVDGAKAELLSIPDDDVRRSFTGGERAVELSGELRVEFAPYVALLPLELSAAKAAERKADWDGIGARADVFLAADVLAQLPWAPETRKRVRELTAFLRKFDKTCTSWAGPIFADEPDAQETIEVIRPGSGLRDDARDSIQWAALYERFWPLAEGKLPYTPEQLRDASAKGLEQLKLYEAGSNDKGSPADLRNRAFTLWAGCYDRLSQTGIYLAGEHPSIGGHFPGISSYKRKPKAQAKGEAEGQTDQPTPEA